MKKPNDTPSFRGAQEIQNEAKVDLRAGLLASSPGKYGLKPTTELPRVWAAMMEIGVPKGAASIVAVADGSASMYTSVGGGMIGVGEHPSGRQAAMHFLKTVGSLLELIPVVRDVPLPPPGEYALVALTHDGTRRRVTAAEKSLKDARHPVFAAFDAGQDLLTAMRLLGEKLAAERRAQR
jgi:hypothetical protein